MTGRIHRRDLLLGQPVGGHRAAILGPARAARMADSPLTRRAIDEIVRLGIVVDDSTARFARDDATTCPGPHTEVDLEEGRALGFGPPGIRPERVREDERDLPSLMIPYSADPPLESGIISD